MRLRARPLYENEKRQAAKCEKDFNILRSFKIFDIRDLCINCMQSHEKFDF